MKKMSADKPHSLAYLKHTPGFEQPVRTFINLPTSETLTRVKEEDEQARIVNQIHTPWTRTRKEGTAVAAIPS